MMFEGKTFLVNLVWLHQVCGLDGKLELNKNAVFGKTKFKYQQQEQKQKQKLQINSMAVPTSEWSQPKEGVCGAFKCITTKSTFVGVLRIQTHTSVRMEHMDMSVHSFIQWVY